MTFDKLLTYMYINHSITRREKRDLVTWWKPFEWRHPVPLYVVVLWQENSPGSGDGAHNMSVDEFDDQGTYIGKALG